MLALEGGSPEKGKVALTGISMQAWERGRPSPTIWEGHKELRGTFSTEEKTQLPVDSRQELSPLFHLAIGFLSETRNGL